MTECNSDYYYYYYYNYPWYLVPKGLEFITIGGIIFKCISDGCPYYHDRAQNSKC